MPLNLADRNVEHIILRVGGSPEVRQHLENLGFVPGHAVMVISELNGNVIVKVKESRIAIDQVMARKIMV